MQDDVAERSPKRGVCTGQEMVYVACRENEDNDKARRKENESNCRLAKSLRKDHATMWTV